MNIDRLFSFIMMLLENERISAQELADMFEVSPRIIYCDIDLINMAGIPVCSAREMRWSIQIIGGGFYYSKIGLGTILDIDSCQVIESFSTH